MASVSTELVAAAEAQLDLWGEDIIYTPLGGSPRTIVAIVDRGTPREIGGPGQALRPVNSIEVLNRQTAKGADGYGGIGSDEVDTGGDTVTVAVRIGKAARVMRLAQPMEHDVAMVSAEVR